MTASSELDGVAEMFRVLAEIDFRGSSPLYERLAREASNEPELLSPLLAAGPTDRLPHLLFAAIQYLLLRDGSSPIEAFGSEPFAAFRSWCVAHRSEIEQTVATHVVQTNEVGRCAGLLPCLARVAEATQQPLAIVEVGASAGLNLCFDRYRYVYAPGHEPGPADSPVMLRPRLEGGLVPTLTVPQVVWRTGLDRRPVDVTDDDEVRWLRSCIWPEQTWRAELLERAVEVARSDPPTVVRGDAVDSLAEIVRGAPEDAALCVAHTALISYLPDPARFTARLVELARERPLWWVSGEAEGLVPGLSARPAADDRISFLYGVVPLGMADQAASAVARAGPHGAWLEWLDPHTGHR